MRLIKEGVRTLLKKWFILLIVLSCAIFAVSSGCSEESKENVTKDVIESSKGNITPGVENTEENISINKVVESEKNLSNDSGKGNALYVESTGGSVGETSKIVESTGGSVGEMSKTVESTGNSGGETNEGIESTRNSEEGTNAVIESTGSDSWCPVGSSWTTVNPETNEEVTMKITGLETVDGIPMCKAVYETNNKDEKISKLEYIWSQDGKTYIWTAYDISGKKISEVSMKDGKIEKTL